MLTKQDLHWLVENLPKDITQSIITAYFPLSLFIMDNKYLDMQDWSYLLRLIFNITTQSDIYAYYCACLRSNFSDQNPQISCGHCHSVITRNGKITVYGDQFKNINFPQNTVHIANGDGYIIIKTSDGTLMGIGNNQHGQLGLGDQINRTQFEPIPNIPDIAQIRPSRYRTWILSTDGTLMYSGADAFSNKITCQFTVYTTRKDIIQVDCGLHHIVILCGDGTVLSCGSNSHGQLGLGDFVDQLSFKEVPLQLKNKEFIKQIICGSFNTFLIIGDQCSSESKLMGSGCCVASSTIYLSKFCEIENIMDQYQIVTIPRDIIQVACGNAHTVILLSDGSIMACGYNAYGQLGCGSYKSQPLLEKNDNISNVIQVACGQFHTLLLTKDGTVMSCGQNSSGQLGHNYTSSRINFEKVNI